MLDNPSNSTNSTTTKRKHKIRPLRLKHKTTEGQKKRKCRRCIRHMLRRSADKWKNRSEDSMTRAEAVASTSTASTSTTEPMPNYMHYLKLMPKGQSPPEENKQEDNNSEFEFRKPIIYECEYCPKIFYHKYVHLKHTIRHLKCINWCLKCKRAFGNNIAVKKHRCQITFIRKW